VLVNWPFIWARRTQDFMPKVVIFGTDFEESLSEQDRRVGSSQPSAHYYLRESFEALTDALGWTAYLASVEMNLATLRRDAGLVRRWPWRSGKSLSRMIHRARVLADEMDRLDRLTLDMTANEGLVRNRFNDGIGSAELLSTTEKKSKLGDFIYTSGSERIVNLKKQFARLSESIERRLSLRNIELLYRFQRLVVVLSVIAAFAAAIALFGLDDKAWDRLMRVLAWIRSFLGEYWR
jgi:hypothetical protein